MTGETIKARLEEIRAEIRANLISYAEIAELQGLAEHIEPGDVELLEWAGIPEAVEERGPSVTIPWSRATGLNPPYRFDLDELSYRQVNDLAIDVVVELAGRSNREPAEVLEAMLRTGRETGAIS